MSACRGLRGEVRGRMGVGEAWMARDTGAWRAWASWPGLLSREISSRDAAQEMSVYGPGKGCEDRSPDAPEGERQAQDARGGPTGERGCRRAQRRWTVDFFRGACGERPGGSVSVSEA